MELVYKRAGNIELVRYRDSRRFLKNGVVQSITPQLTNNTTTLQDGNSAMDLVFSSGKAGQITVNLNSFQPALYAALIAAEYAEGAQQTIRKIEETSVPSSSPYEVSLAKTPVSGTVVVHNEDDSPFVSVGSSPAVGQFAVSGSTVTFNSLNADNEVIIAYDVSATSKRAQLSHEANNDVFRLTVTGSAVLRKDEGVSKIDALTFDRVMPTGDIAMPQRQKEPQGWNFTLQVLRPRPGYKAVDYVVEE